MRRSKNSRWLTTLSLLGLIIVSVLMVLVLDAGALANPTVPLGGGGPVGNQGPTAYLAVDLFSNSDEAYKLSLPTTNSTYPIGEWPVKVTQAITGSTSAAPAVYPMVTDPEGGAEQGLPAGAYTVSFVVESITVQVPVTVEAQNATRAIITVTGMDFPIVYSEESPSALIAGGIQSTMYAEVDASSTTVKAGEPVVIKSLDAAPGAGRIADATVVLQEPTGHGTELLLLATQKPFTPFDATSIYLTTWTFSSNVTTTHVGNNGVSPDA